MMKDKTYDFSNSVSIDFDNYLIDLSKEITEPQPLISISDNPLFTRGNISCISGKAKSRKTFLIGLFASQFLEYATEENVIIFDTEQAPYHIQKSTKRIHRLLEWNDNESSEKLRVFALRELATDKRKEFIKSAIENYRPDFIFIDGVRDLLTDFNNIAESSELVNLLMNLSSTYDCHICAVLHENKGDNNLRGHAGTELQNKSETVISVEADGNISAVSPKYCRNIPFEKFYFRVNEYGLPEYCEPEIKPKNTDKLKIFFDEILPATTTLSYADLSVKITERMGVVTRTAERHIKTATEQKIISKNDVGLYYSVDNNIVEIQNDFPF